MTYLEMDIICSRFFLFLKYGSHPMIAGFFFFFLIHPVCCDSLQQLVLNNNSQVKITMATHVFK